MIRNLLMLRVIFISFTLPAQDSLTIEQRVKLLEQYNEQILDEKFNIASAKLNGEIELELKRATTSLDERISILKIVGIIISLGLGGLVYTSWRNAKRTMEKMLEKKLKSHLADNINHLVDVITSQKTENLIKKSKKILLLGSSEKECDSATKLLKSMQFDHVSCKAVKYYEKLPENDLVVFCNMNNSTHQELVVEFIEKGDSDDVFIYYGGRLNLDSKSSHYDKVNFANSRYTLYHQIINTLSFKEVINTKRHE